jgi:O-antigen/teichoic acid export membrane protein
LVGQQLGILAVFGFQGSLQAGTFFIAQTIFLIVYLLPGSFMTVLFPVLSGSTSEAGELGWRALKLCLALSCPLAAFFALYSAFPLSLIGGGYVQAASVLSLLALSIIPQVFVSAVSSFVYARGSYGKVIGLSLATTVPQVVLYFKLVPLYGGYGAALSYLIGVLTGAVAAIFVSKRAAFKLFPRKIAVAVIAPFLAAFPSFLFGLNWLLGGGIILLMSVLCYGRLGVVERRDLAEVGQAFASKETIAKASERLNWILRVIYGD